jgi:5-hydroxyisourate hydrolase
MTEGGRVTLHVLDTACGAPAAGLPFTLSRLADGRRITLAQGATDHDGRAPAPLLGAGALVAGSYEILFDVAAWRAAMAPAESGFYDLIPIRFVVRDPTAHYHIPLLLAPFGYSTYRGS